MRHGAIFAVSSVEGAVEFEQLRSMRSFSPVAGYLGAPGAAEPAGPMSAQYIATSARGPEGFPNGFETVNRLSNGISSAVSNASACVSLA